MISERCLPDSCSSTLNGHYSTLHLSESMLPSYLALVLVSCLFIWLCPVLFALQPSLRAPPGDLILWQLLAQLSIELSWVDSAVHIALDGGLQDGIVCTSVGSLATMLPSYIAVTS